MKVTYIVLWVFSTFGFEPVQTFESTAVSLETALVQCQRAAESIQLAAGAITRCLPLRVNPNRGS